MGNTSVLQMVVWYLLSSTSSSSSFHYDRVEAVGVEARSEAVELARRSLSFNLGVGGAGTNDDVRGHHRQGGTRRIEHDVWIIRGDFCDLASLSSSGAEVGARSIPPRAAGGARDDRDCPFASTMEAAASTRYDLITGTPPYFCVVFASSGDGAHDERTLADGKDDDRDIDEDGVITSAVIQQGGMLTSMQSAPARCEFRGGSKPTVSRPRGCCRPAGHSSFARSGPKTIACGGGPCHSADDNRKRRGWKMDQ